MLDLQLLRTDIEGTARRLGQRGFVLDTKTFESLEHQRKAIQTETQELQSRRNQLSKQVGQLKAKGEDASAVMAEVTAQADRLKALEQELADIQGKINEFLMVVPNAPHESVPPGESADDNAEVRKVGTPRAFDFPVKDHVDVGQSMGMLDFDSAVKI